MVDYSPFAFSFSKTRKNKKYNIVSSFLFDIENKSLLELGCGNGRNMKGIKNALGVEICPNMCEICKTKGYNVICDNALTFTSEKQYDYIICIAVIHHFEKEEDRIKLLQNINNLLKEGGKALITCWIPSNKSSSSVCRKKIIERGTWTNIPFQNKNRYYYIFKENELYELSKNIFRSVKYVFECDNDCVIVEK